MALALGARLVGLGMVAAGVALAWFFGLQPLEAARAGASEVTYQVKLFVAAPLFIVAGLFLAVGGRPVGEAFSGPPEGRQQKAIVFAVFAAAIVSGGAAFWWFDRQLAMLGYVAGV